MLKIIILDDEKTQIEYIESILKSIITEETNTSTYYDVETFLKDLNTFSDYTIFILDIILQRHNGIDLAKVINEYITNPIIIFVSGYLDKAADVYETEHCYFVYKPQLEKNLPKAIQKATFLLQEAKKTLPIQKKEGSILLLLDDILFLERNKRTTLIQCNHEVVTCSYKLEYLLPLLSTSFIQCHRSYIVNLNKVKKYTASSFSMIDSNNIPISRSHYHKTKEKWLLYLKNKL